MSLDPWTVFWVVAGVAVALSGLVGRDVRRGTARETLSHLGGRFGLPLSQRGSLKLAGLVDGLRVEVRWVEGEASGFRMMARGRLPAGFGLEARRGKRRRPDEVATGDADFDADLLVWGRPSDVLSRLGQRARQLVWSAVSAGVGVEDAVVAVTVPADDGLSLDLVTRLEQLVELAHSLAPRDTTTRGRLLASVRDDPCLPFRRRCLAVLGARHPHAAETAAALDAATEDDALGALAKALMGSAEPALASLLEDAEGLVVEAAIQRLEALGTPAALAALASWTPAAGSAIAARREVALARLRQQVGDRHGGLSLAVQRSGGLALADSDEEA